MPNTELDRVIRSMERKLRRTLTPAERVLVTAMFHHDRHQLTRKVDDR